MKLLSLGLELPPATPVPVAAVETPPVTASVEGDVSNVPISDIKALETMFMAVRTHSGQTITPEKARRCSVVLACMRGISEDLSSLKIRVKKRGPNGDTEDTSHPLHRILNIAPNLVMTPIELREHIIFDLILSGAFYTLVNEDPYKPGVLDSVWPLQAQYVTRRSLALAWTYTDPLTGTSGSFTPETVWRGTLMSSNALDGTALTLLAREAIGLLIAAEEQGARLFSYGVQSDFALSTDGDLDDETQEQLRRAFMQRHSGSNNAFMPMIFSGGLKASRIGLTAAESQYIEARKFQIEDIARVFRYPEVLLGTSSGKSSTYASASEFFDSYTKHTLGPWATRIEQTIHRDLLTTKEQAKYYVEHDFSSLLRANKAARFSTYAAGILAGILSPHECRVEEGLPYVPGLDYYTRPLNNTAVAGADATSIKPTDQSALVDGVKPTAVRELYFPPKEEAIHE